MIAVTGANGQLGQLVIEGFVERVPASQIIAAVRSPKKASSFRTLGVQVREADYTRPETLSTALDGVKKVLLISAAESAFNVDAGLQRSFPSARDFVLSFGSGRVQCNEPPAFQPVPNQR